MYGPWKVRAVGQDAEAGRRRGGVGPMAVAIERVRIGVGDDGVAQAARVVVVADEIEPAGDLGGRERGRADRRAVVAREVRRIAGPSEVGVVVVDPGVDDPDLDAATGQPARGRPGRRHARVRVADHVGQPVDRYRHDPLDPGQRPDPGQLAGRHPDLDPVVRVLVLPEDPRAHRRERRQEGDLAGPKPDRITLCPSSDSRRPCSRAPASWTATGDPRNSTTTVVWRAGSRTAGIQPSRDARFESAAAAGRAVAASTASVTIATAARRIDRRRLASIPIDGADDDLPGQTGRVHEFLPVDLGRPVRCEAAPPRVGRLAVLLAACPLPWRGPRTRVIRRRAHGCTRPRPSARAPARPDPVASRGGTSRLGGRPGQSPASVSRTTSPSRAPENGFSSRVTPPWIGRPTVNAV